MSGKKKKPGLLQRLFSRSYDDNDDEDGDCVIQTGHSNDQSSTSKERRHSEKTGQRHLGDKEIEDNNKERKKSDSELLRKEKNEKKADKHKKERHDLGENDHGDSHGRHGSANGDGDKKQASSEHRGGGKGVPTGNASLSSQQKKRRRRKKAGGGSSSLSIDVSKPLEFPCTPEVILAYHKRKAILSSTEEKIIVELTEFECLIDSREVLQMIAKHCKFIDVEPHDLWEEFFDFVDELSSYDEVINIDVWQEFKDEKYPY